MPRKVLSRKLAGWSGQEGCQRLLNDPPSEDCRGKTTRHYGEDVNYGDVTGFTGWRGPFCSAACYRLAYPEGS
jgi:hypothetical protein